MKMFIFVQETLFIADTALLDISKDLRVILFKQKSIVNAFATLFNFFWQKSKNVREWKEQNQDLLESEK